MRALPEHSYDETSRTLHRILRAIERHAGELADAVESVDYRTEHSEEILQRRLAQLPAALSAYRIAHGL